jgi:hypothetical protein
MNMIFSTKQQNYSQYIQSQNQIQTQTQNQNTMLLRMNRSVRYIPNKSTNTEVIDNKVDEQIPKKMKWGEPTWFLFHTMAHKIKEEHFNDLKLDILTIITTICNNLPCPNCANHATEYMKRVNYNSIKTKQDLKNLFFQFHNEVNSRKGFPLFPFEQLDEKYSKALTKNIIQHFMVFFQDKHKSIHMIANDMHRARISNNLKQWFNKNIQYFDN